jgi:hypothetical protein
MQTCRLPTILANKTVRFGRKVGTKWYIGQFIGQIGLKIIKTSNIYIGSMIQTDQNG